MRPSAVLPIAVLLAVGCGGERGQGDGDAPTPERVSYARTPMILLPGEVLFDLKCASCHGAKATGTQQGPPLVHQIYEPGHHGDPAFFRAVEMGVRAHHWGFGAMPPVEGVSRADVSLIVNYVRWLQRQGGIN